MTWYVRSPEKNVTDQTLLFSIPKGNKSISLAARFVFRKKINKWTVTVMDGTTLKELISNVPLVCTPDEETLNGVLRQFGYIGAGDIVCQGTRTDLATEDPYGRNLTAWTVLWGDGIG